MQSVLERIFSCRLWYCSNKIIQSARMLKRHFKQLICSYEFALHVGMSRNAHNLERTGHVSPRPSSRASVFSLPQQSDTLRRNTSHKVPFSAVQKKDFRAVGNCRQAEHTLYTQPEETPLMKNPNPQWRVQSAVSRVFLNGNPRFGKATNCVAHGFCSLSPI